LTGFFIWLQAPEAVEEGIDPQHVQSPKPALSGVIRCGPRRHRVALRRPAGSL